ncbi:hypothetical protein H5410_015813 [Solanum commersonii]|uniref:Aminotransferase-like plant mobile domain-containing protein n=1 Tax=Solanum commersonii TaxID=4109 RepID=A0A9J5ZUI5_SOLCO|nr:hypothetical protein H5410_015813 [Solanum commersonii]
MERVVNPGPTNRTLLISQYKSKLLWKGEISFSSLMRTVHMNDAWNLFRLHRPHRRVEKILCRSGLYDIVCVGMMQNDRAFVTAMVERWRPDFHCFHLPFREDAAWRIHPWHTLLETLTGCAIAPTDMDIGESSKDTLHYRLLARSVTSRSDTRCYSSGAG